MLRGPPRSTPVHTLSLHDALPILSDNMPAPDTSGLQAVAGVFGKIAQAEQDKANTAAQMEIENQLAGLENSTLYDADSGFLNRQGKDAIRSEEHTYELQSLMRIS